MKQENDIYNIFKTEKDLSKNKINYIPITYRDRKPKTNRSRNKHLETNNINTNTNSKFETNTVYLDLSFNSKNKMLSAK